jgi:hypothetical protein
MALPSLMSLSLAGRPEMKPLPGSAGQLCATADDRPMNAKKEAIGVRIEPSHSEQF